MSIRIFFAPTPWASAKKVLEDYRFQTPGNLGNWQRIEAVNSPKDANYLIIQDECIEPALLAMFPPGRRLYFNREALTPDVINDYPIDKYVRFSFWDGSGYLPLRWVYRSESQVGYTGIDYDYDSLCSLKPVLKSKKICSILSNKKFTNGHALRIKFLKKFAQIIPIDIYGSVSLSNSTLIDNQKSSTLSQYKYCLGFDNQDSIRDFIGTQCTDAMLMWTVPIFWCGTELGKYFPKGSFIQFNARDSKEINRIREILENDDYDMRVAALAEARELLLNKYNFWPTILKVIEKAERE